MDDSTKTVPYIAFELMQAKYERTVKRLIITLIVTICLMFASNIGWIAFISQYDYSDTSISYTQDSKGLNLINSDIDGDIINGADSKDQN